MLTRKFSKLSENLFLGLYGASFTILTHFVTVLSLFQWFSVLYSQSGKTHFKNLAWTFKIERFAKIKAVNFKVFKIFKVYLTIFVTEY